MTAKTTITCTKSEFSARLRNEYVNGAIDARADIAELNEVIDGLVRQANNHRGTFAGHSAYLDCDFTVTPDEAPAKRWPTDEEIRANHQKLITADSPDEITIPAVTNAQRAQARDAAYRTVDHVVENLRVMTADFGGLNQERLASEIHKLMAALGHLVIADGEVRES